jgi:hypothetical protein
MMNSREAMRFAEEVYHARESYTLEVLPISFAKLVQQLQNKEIGYEEMNAGYLELAGRNTDWFGLLFRNTFNHNHNVSISGGTDRVVNRTSFSIQGQNGEAVGNDMFTLTASSNTTFRLRDNLLLNLLLNGSIRETNGFAYGVNPFNYAYNTSRTIPMYNDDGTFFFHEKKGSPSTAITGKNTYLYNIQNELDNTGNMNMTNVLGGTIDLRWRPFEGLEYQGLLSYNTSSSEVKSYATEMSYYITNIRGYEYGSVLPNSEEQQRSRLPFGGLVQLENSINRDYTFRNSLVYSQSFNDVHRLTLQLGMELRSATTNGNSSTRYGYLHYRGESYGEVPLMYRNQTLSTLLENPLHGVNSGMTGNSKIVNNKNNKLSEYLTGVYNYAERYTLNFNARLDASNRFGQDENKRFNPTWSIGGKWRIGNESLFDAMDWMNSFDLSASYGYQGNAVESVSPNLIARDNGLNALFKQYTLTIKSLPYPDLGWEETNSWNLGLDFTFLNGRVSATANLFRKVSDVLDQRSVLVENGMNSAIVFGTRMINRGYDFVVSVTPVRTKDFLWQFSVNSALARNTVKENQRVDYDYTDYTGGSAVVDGESYSTFYSFAFDGLAPETGYPTFKYFDTPAEDRTDNELDFLVKTGKNEPDISGGFNTMLRYKNLSVHAQFAFAFGSQKRLPPYYNSSGAPTPEQNVPRILDSRWKKPGDDTKIPAIPAGNNVRLLDMNLPLLSSQPRMTSYSIYNLSDVMVADADFLRCRQLSVTYNFPLEILKKIHAKRLGLSASMSNPFLIAFDKAWRGYDPETGQWPARRTASLSLNMTF